MAAMRPQPQCRLKLKKKKAPSAPDAAMAVTCAATVAVVVSALKVQTAKAVTAAMAAAVAVAAVAVMVTAPHVVTVHPVWKVTALHASRVTARHAQRAIALLATATVPRAKALMPASRVNLAPMAMVAANVVAVAVASAQTAHRAATCQQRKTLPPTQPEMVLKSKETRKTQVNSVQIAPPEKTAAKVVVVSAVVVAVASAVKAAATAQHAMSSAQTKPKAAVQTWLLPVWQQVP